MISIIMPTFNRQDCIHLALGSVIGQEYRSWELWVVDDGSDEPYHHFIAMLLAEQGREFQDGILFFGRERVHTFRLDEGRVIYLRRLSQHYGHPSPVRNAAMEDLRGELVCFRDDDGYWPPNWLGEMAAAFGDSEVVMAYGNRNISHLASLNFFNRDYADRYGTLYNPGFRDGDFSAGADTGDVMLRMKAFRESGGFDSPELTGGQEDRFLWRKIVERNPAGKVVYVPGATNYYIWHNSDRPNRTGGR